jgi:hypothetical protein
MPVVDLDEFVGELNELHGPGEKDDARYALRIAFPNDIVTHSRSDGPWPVARLAGVE